MSKKYMYSFRNSFTILRRGIDNFYYRKLSVDILSLPRISLFIL
ncbi:MAG: hypothetical protein PUK70_03510 [Bacteroidales bacterium]|nr:hypothetical protein [Bacteroidales bacterium]MDY6000813.1 hypothetical protein [Candidatus Cryptobacteroides sp.]